MLIVQDHIEKLLFFQGKVNLNHLGMCISGLFQDLETGMAAYDIACALVPDDILDQTEAVERVSDGALFFLGALSRVVGSGIEAAESYTSTGPPLDFAILAVL
jgi:hypothetical protein